LAKFHYLLFWRLWHSNGVWFSQSVTEFSKPFNNSWSILNAISLCGFVTRVVLVQFLEQFVI
jgi:hypothetical protein